MNHHPRTPVRVRHPLRLRPVQVSRVETISPRMRRITLGGDALAGFSSAAADDHVKLFFPAPGQERPVLPELGPDGPTYPPGAVQPVVRDYTPRRFDPERRELVVEFVIHADGPASNWAAQAAPGQWIGVGGPRGSFLLPDDYDSHLLIGDETALPAIARQLEEFQPGVRAVVLIEVADAREERPLPTAANATVRWLHRGGLPAGTPAPLEDVLRGLALSAGDTHAWIAGEIETARRLRHHLVAERGLSRTQVRAAGYWRLGDAGTHARLDDDEVA